MRRRQLLLGAAALAVPVPKTRKPVILNYATLQQMAACSSFVRALIELRTSYALTISYRPINVLGEL